MKHDLIITDELTAVQNQQSNGKIVIQQRPICGSDLVIAI